VINGEISRAVDELRSIIIAHRCQFKARQKDFQEILKSFKPAPELKREVR